ncbi:hypothetical protein TNCV_3480881 [Trichonephila clavipes]|nr:hypothetical protein TNCV_3480881 [Trichonephila clavipes]
MTILDAEDSLFWWDPATESQGKRFLCTGIGVVAHACWMRKMMTARSTDDRAESEEAGSEKDVPLVDPDSV